MNGSNAVLDSRSLGGAKALSYLTLLTLVLGGGLAVACIWPSDAEWYWLCITGVTLISIIVTLIKNYIISRRNIFSPWICFPIAYLVWFAIGSVNFLDIPSSISFGAFDPIPAKMWVYYLIGLIGYFVGVMVCPRNGSSRRVPPLVWDMVRFKVVVGFMALAAFCSFLWIVSDLGIPVLSVTAGLDRSGVGRHGPALAIMLSGSWTVILFLLIYLWRMGPRSWPKFVAVSGVVVTSTILLSFGGRTWLFEAALTAIILRHYLYKRYKLRTLAIAATLVFVGIGVYGYVRDTSLVEALRGGVGQSFLAKAGIPSGVVPFAYGYLYVRYPVATFRDVVTVVPSQVPYQYGRLTFQPFDTLLPGRHTSSDYFFKEILGSEFIGAGQPATLLGTFYGDFGVGGIFVGMLLYGLLLAKTYRWALRSGSAFCHLTYAWVLHAGLFGLFITVFPYLTTLWMPLMWWGLDDFVSTKG